MKHRYRAIFSAMVAAVNSASVEESDTNDWNIVLHVIKPKLADQWFMTVVPMEWSWAQLPPPLPCSLIHLRSRVPSQIGSMQPLGDLYPWQHPTKRLRGQAVVQFRGVYLLFRVTLKSDYGQVIVKTQY